MKRCASLLFVLSLFLFSFHFVQAQSRPRRVGDNSSSSTSSEPGETGRPPVLSNRSSGPSSRETDQKEDAGPSSAREEVGADEVVRVNTTLVTVPVSVMDRDGKYIPDLRQTDFRLYEDGVEQEIAYFASVEKPFAVVVMIDVSRSTRFKMEEIQDAAVAFVNQLREDDRVMVVSFDDEVHVLSEFTSDRQSLRSAIMRTRTGGGTSLYDAVDFVINRRLNRISGRKAIVLFTDGVDSTSDRASYESTVRDAEELDALIYPIQYDTYEGGVFSGGGWPGQRRPSIILRWPFPMPTPGPRGGGGGGASRGDYERGARYLQDLAEKTGARVSEANDMANLERSFELIAEELRRQYSLGYYPKAASRTGERRQIRVRTRQPNLVVRARDSYITAPSEAVATQDRQKQRFGF